MIKKIVIVSYAIVCIVGYLRKTLMRRSLQFRTCVRLSRWNHPTVSVKAVCFMLDLQTFSSDNSESSEHTNSIRLRRLNMKIPSLLEEEFKLFPNRSEVLAVFLSKDQLWKTCCQNLM